MLLAACGQAAPAATPTSSPTILAVHTETPTDQVELVAVTVTPSIPAMQPVEVTPTKVLTQAEEDEHTRRAIEAMQTSTAPLITPGAQP
jgi:hypothetical protein